MAQLKDTVIQGTAGLTLPVGTIAQRNSNPSDGEMRYNTELGYVEYYYKGFWGQAQSSWGIPPFNGLVGYWNPGLDAVAKGWTNSQTLSGQSLTDWSGNGNTATISGTPTYNSNYGGTLTLTTSQSVLTPINHASQSGTVICLSRYNGGTNGRICTASSNNWLLGHWNTGVLQYYSAGWITSSSSNQFSPGTGQPDYTTFHIYAGTYGIGTSGYYGFFVNGGLGSRGTGGSAGPNQLGYNLYSSEPSSCEVGILMCWNRVLTDYEIMKATAAIQLRTGL